MTIAKRALLVTSLTLAACASGGGEGPRTSSNESSKGKHDLLNNPAPGLAGESVNGKGKVSLDQWKGKVVLVDFWATWCEPCKKSFPKLEELRVKYGASGLEIVGISEDDEDGGAIVYQLKGHPWSIFALWPDEKFDEYAAELSKELDADVLTFANSDFSGWSFVDLYRGGEEVEALHWGEDLSEIGAPADPADVPIPYMARTRAYYQALGYAEPYRWAHFAEVPFARLGKPLSDCATRASTAT